MFATLTLLINLAELDRKIAEATPRSNPSGHPDLQPAETPVPVAAEALEIARSERRMKGWKGDRQNLTLQLPEGLRNQYEQIRSHRGTALAPVTRGSCGGCRIVIRRAVCEKLKVRNEIVTCEFCGRILYASETVAPPALQN